MSKKKDEDDKPTEMDDCECFLCYDILYYPVVLHCKHILCKECFVKHIEANGFTCPMCRFRLSNWLRKVNKEKENILHESLWKKIQKKFPDDVSRRKNKTSKDKDPVSVETTTSPEYRNACVPNHQLCKPGEIRKWYQEELRKEMEEEMKLSADVIKKLEDEYKKEEEERQEQLRKDEEYARKLREEFLKEQLVASETHTSLLVALASSSPKSGSYTDRSNDDTPSDPDWELRLAGDVIYEGPVLPPPPHITTISSEERTHCSTPLPTSSHQPLLDTNVSPIRFDMPSTSTDPRFGRFSPPVPSESSSSLNASVKPRDLEPTASSSQAPVSASVSSSNEAAGPSNFAPVLPASSQGPVPTTISLPTEAMSSHFVPVQRNHTTSFQGEVVLEQVPESRCSSGGDSISQELHHFKPIRSSPTTRPKDGSTDVLPHMVVAQMGTANSQHLDTVTSLISMEEDDQVVLQQCSIEQEIEKKKKKREQQIEEDEKLARQILKTDQEEFKKTLKKTKKNYNLRKRTPKKTLRKKVLVDRAQATLDNMLVRN